jgi:hypothetical protein
MTQFEKQLILSCITDLRWWLDGLAFTLFIFVAVLTIILLGA